MTHCALPNRNGQISNMQNTTEGIKGVMDKEMCDQMWHIWDFQGLSYIHSSVRSVDKWLQFHWGLMAAAEVFINI